MKCAGCCGVQSIDAKKSKRTKIRPILARFVWQHSDNDIAVSRHAVVRAEGGVNYVRNATRMADHTTRKWTLSINSMWATTCRCTSIWVTIRIGCPTEILVHVVSSWSALAMVLIVSSLHMVCLGRPSRRDNSIPRWHLNIHK
jgi:hypothetical protein